MIPNLTPIVMMLGYMGWTGLRVDGLTMMVGAIVLVITSYSIHYTKLYDTADFPDLRRMCA